MRKAVKEDIPEVSDLFSRLWAYVKDYYYAESDEDWEEAIANARGLVCGEEGTPLRTLSTDMIVNIITFISASKPMS